MVFKIRIGFGLDYFGPGRIRILKFTNYRIGNFQSDPMHTFITHKNLCTLAAEFHCKFYFGHFTIYKNVNYNYNNTNMDIQRHTHAHLQLYAYSISSIMVYMI